MFTYMAPLGPPPPPQPTALSHGWAPGWALCVSSSFPPAICFAHGSIQNLLLLYQFLSPSVPRSTLCPPVCSLSLHLCLDDLVNLTISLPRENIYTTCDLCWFFLLCMGSNFNFLSPTFHLLIIHSRRSFKSNLRFAEFIRDCGDFVLPLFIYWDAIC